METINAGTWLFNLALTKPSFIDDNDDIAFNFTCNGTLFDSIWFRHVGDNFAFDYEGNISETAYVKSWSASEYRTIVVETPQTVSSDFYTWFIANATEKPTTITHNGNEIASIERGQKVTLSCNSRKAKSDIVVVFASAGTITYNGTETAVGLGKTATLACNGKKMLSDVVVSV